MSTTTMTNPSAIAVPAPAPARRDLRHPLEIPAVLVCVGVNLLLAALAVAVLWSGTAWLSTHPYFSRHADAMRAIAVAVLLALPAAAWGRHVKRYAERGNGIQLSPTQLPLCHELLLDACRRLGVDEVPELYLVPRTDLETMSVASSVFGKRSLVALSTELFGREWQKNERAIAFALGQAVGALRLGHTRWWVEMLTTYAMRIPFVRTPVRAVFAFSRDRCGAVVAPDGMSGLVIHAAGKELVRQIDIPSFARQAMEYRGTWALLSGMKRKRPHLLLRARLLYEAGFFDYARDTGTTR
jgi:hypothetical protein